MRRGWGRAGSLRAPPESIQDTGSLQQPVALCMLCRLDSIACRQPSLAWVPSKIKNWTHLRQTDSQITLSCVTWRTDVFLLYWTAQMGHVFLQSGSQVNAWHMELPACLSQGEAKGKVQTPWACQQVRGCRNQPGGPKGANSIKPPLKMFFVLFRLDHKIWKQGRVDELHNHNIYSFPISCGLNCHT